MLDPQARLAVEVALNVYRGILRKLEENDYDNFRKRAYVSKPEKFLMLPQSWMNVKDMAP
jgi:phytoene synthase